jgi:hypothetical protein
MAEVGDQVPVDLVAGAEIQICGGVHEGGLNAELRAVLAGNSRAIPLTWKVGGLTRVFGISHANADTQSQILRTLLSRSLQNRCQ